MPPCIVCWSGRISLIWHEILPAGASWRLFFSRVLNAKPSSLHISRQCTGYSSINMSCCILNWNLHNFHKAGKKIISKLNDTTKLLMDRQSRANRSLQFITSWCLRPSSPKRLKKLPRVNRDLFEWPLIRDSKSSLLWISYPRGHRPCWAKPLSDDDLCWESQEQGLGYSGQFLPTSKCCILSTFCSYYKWERQELGQPRLSNDLPWIIFISTQFPAFQPWVALTLLISAKFRHESLHLWL